MPHIVIGDPHAAKKRVDFSSMNFDYSYPPGLSLKPGSKLHSKLRDFIWERANLSATVMRNRYGMWNKVDKVLTSYIDLDAEELETLCKDPRKPVSIVFPYSFAILETLIAYLLAAFNQNPIFRYEGSGPEDTPGAILMTKVIAQQCIRNKVGLNLHTMFRDALSYGFGITTPGWTTTRAKKRRVIEQAGFVSKMFGMIGGKRQEEWVDQIVFEGNSLENISPYLCFPDTNVPIDQIQTGEFFSWVSFTNYMDMLSDEKADPDKIFNVKYLQGLANYETSIVTGDESKREHSQGGSLRSQLEAVTHEVGNIHMYVKIIPSDLGLGQSDYPEKWYFTLSADNVITEARPIGLNHDLFPVVVCAPDYDGYSSTPLARMETMMGLQKNLDFLFNMHMTNVRKAINDMFVVDPYSINTNDVKDPKPGKLIRTRRPIWGKGVTDSIMQLQVNDITRGNIQDSSWIVQWMQKVGGADDAAMGSLRQGGPERLTGMEFQGTRNAALNRLDRMTSVIGMQSMQDMGYMFASHNQQLMKRKTWIKATGDDRERIIQLFGNDKVSVNPRDLDIDYDLIIRDGSVPGGNYSPVWEKMFETIAGQPELQQKFDIQRIAMYILRANGAKNVDDFIKVTVAPDEQAQEMAASQGMQPTGQAVPEMNPETMMAMMGGQQG